MTSINLLYVSALGCYQRFFFKSEGYKPNMLNYLCVARTGMIKMLQFSIHKTEKQNNCSVVILQLQCCYITIAVLLYYTCSVVILQPCDSRPGTSS